MKCAIHNDRDADGMCVTCGKPFCRECLITLEDRFYCKKHVVDIFKAGSDNNINPNDEKNNNVIYNHNYNHIKSPKSRAIAFLLCLFLGAFGLHRFYVGKVITGILYFFTFGFFTVGWFFDILMLGIGKFKDRRGFYLK